MSDKPSKEAMAFRGWIDYRTGGNLDGCVLNDIVQSFDRSFAPRLEALEAVRDAVIANSHDEGLHHPDCDYIYHERRDCDCGFKDINLSLKKCDEFYDQRKIDSTG